MFLAHFLNTEPTKALQKVLFQKIFRFTFWTSNLFNFWWPRNNFQLWRPFVGAKKKHTPVFSRAVSPRFPWAHGSSTGGFHFGGLSTTLGRVCQSHADGFGFQHLRALGPKVKNLEIFEGCLMEDLVGCVCEWSTVYSFCLNVLFMQISYSCI